MNRLILIGNGFDRAHDMPTDYVSFIKWYLKQCFNTANGIDVYGDLLNITRNTNYPMAKLPTTDEIDYWIEECCKGKFNLYTLGNPVAGYNGSPSYKFNVEIVSPFFTALLDQCAVKRWVDVEATFYTELTSILAREHSDKKTEEVIKEKLLIGLNADMRHITKKLEEYLITLEKPSFNKKYKEIFRSPIQVNDLDSKSQHYYRRRSMTTLEAGETLVLTFNYTSTVEQYIENDHESHPHKFSINYIHGKINDEESPIVFGFGDELDDKYLHMEREKAKGYFEHIKSFWYFRTSRYRELVRFTDNGDYQVLVLGHSCGLSDRTMLNMILEKPNCKSVKIYYHGDKQHNNYTDITYEIARHFKDKTTMRDRIVSLDESQDMPQATPIA